MKDIVVSIKNLTVSVGQDKHKKHLVSDVSLDIPKEEIVALVGESGSGKTTTGLSIGRLLSPALTIEKGSIIFDGQDLLSVDDQTIQRMRGKDIGFVFQDPLQAFNPLFTIGFQIEEVLKYHTDLNRQERQKQILHLLDTVEIADPQRISKSYPHQLSGGMRQRAMIAQAIAGNPKLIIADEPTSSLDVTIQAKIVELFKELNRTLKLSILLITHDLGLVRHLSNEVVVMKEGKVVEAGHTKAVLTEPKHHYTRELLEAAV
ncbi:MAG: ABC transporter ATP-binding protein [Candidatus Omnitrophica bacterium]|nr:ABC transporter ATP-binding protein [Candidatus Omnitrophota bacterium]